MCFGLDAILLSSKPAVQILIERNRKWFYEFPQINLTVNITRILIRVFRVPERRAPCISLRLF